jgi:hypothetical protein
MLRNKQLIRSKINNNEVQLSSLFVSNKPKHHLANDCCAAMGNAQYLSNRWMILLEPEL